MCRVPRERLCNRHGPLRVSPELVSCSPDAVQLLELVEEWASVKSSLGRRGIGLMTTSPSLALGGSTRCLTLI